MDFEVLRRRVQDEHSVRAQRDAAEKKIPTERLRREIREAFAREAAEEHPASSEADNSDSSETAGK